MDILIYQKIEPYFYELVQKTLKDNHIHVTNQSEAYIISILCDFLKQEKLNNISKDESSFPTLFSIYKEAATSINSFNSYRNLGDLSLFVVGFFDEYINRRHSLNDRNYYLQMGSGAYWRASKLSNHIVFNSVFSELSIKFEDLVNALSKISNEIHL